MCAAATATESARPQLEFWFEFASTYSYLSALRISESASLAGVGVIWRPFLLGPIFAGQGWDTSPFTIYPAKGRYMWRDMARLCAARGLPFSKPRVFPQNGLLAARTALAALRQDNEAGAAFCRAVYAAQFGQDADISDPAVLRDALHRAGLGADLLDAAQTPEIKAALRAQTERAQALGLFGAPSFTIDTELFWGDDRLDQALSWAASGHAASADAPAGAREKVT